MEKCSSMKEGDSNEFSHNESKEGGTYNEYKNEGT